MLTFFSSSPSATVLSCQLQAHKNDVYHFLEELVEKLARLYLPESVWRSPFSISPKSVMQVSRLNITSFEL